MSRSIGPNSLHGTATYNKGCRCEDCRRAMNERNRRYRKRVMLARDPIQFPWECPICKGRFATDFGMMCHRSKAHY